MRKEFSFKEWQNEKDINLVCSDLLDNANMDLKIRSYPLSLELSFFVTGSDIKIVFTCKEIELFSIQKEPNEEAMFTVLETKTEYTEGSWRILIFPEAEIEIKCNSFNWGVVQMSDSEKIM